MKHNHGMKFTTRWAQLIQSYVPDISGNICQNSNGHLFTLPPIFSISKWDNFGSGTTTRMDGWEATVLGRMVAVDGGMPTFYFPFSPLFFYLFVVVVRYANCGNVRPTGLHLRTRRRRTKRSHQSKNIVYYSGGARGNTYNSWAEAKFILVPKK